jgi:3-hydroxy-9,10-secoandrosta-1,3,5(10)-triene-9,17-dione monooxygenase reductase component
LPLNKNELWKETSMESTASSFDRREFRNALGSFATGVTVITARAPDGSPVGLTANSFNSVSLDPPLVLWGLAKTARSMPVFNEAEHWAVHVLAAEQEAVSNAFAKSGEDKFAGIALENGVADLPLLPDCAARFQCRTRFRYEGGDHIIFVGEVVDFDRRQATPLVYHAGRYALAASKDDGRAKLGQDRLAGSFDDDHLGYLLGRAYFQFYTPIRDAVRQHGLDDGEYFVLSTLSIRCQATVAELARLIALTDCLLSESRLDSLVMRGLLLVAEQDGARHYSLSDKGLELSLHLTAVAKAHETDLLHKLGDSDGLALKTLLHRLTQIAGQVPDLWLPGEHPNGC